MPPVPSDDPEDADPGLARERTRLAWARTALAFAAVGAAMLRRELIPGLIVLATTPLIWAVGRFASASHVPRGRPRPGRLLVVTVTVTLVAVLAVVVAFLGHSPASLRQLLHV
jgi:uncharacterized membrane protein YidH (DUF202 family)